MAPHGPPHVQPLPLGVEGSASAPRPRDAWLAFVGLRDRAREQAIGAFRLERGERGADAAYTVEPVAQWPTAVRVLGGVNEGGVTYVLLETVAALDQPGGLRGVWIDDGARRSPFDTSPLALADVHDLDGLAARVGHPSILGTAERNAAALLATLRAASPSAGALARALANEGTDFGVVWQSTFVQKLGHLDGQGAAPSSLTDRALSIVRSALETQACGVDACEAWGDSTHAVVRFVVQSGRWVIRWILEDASPRGASAAPSAASPPASCTPPSPPTPSRPGPRVVDGAADPAATTALLHARARTVVRVLGEAALTSGGGTIGVGLTDLAPDAPVVAVQDGAASQTFVIDEAAGRKPWSDERWDAAFADVDGDGRTDVVLRMEGTRGGTPAAWTQVFLAPLPSVQTTALRADLASALVLLDAPDVRGAAQLAASLPSRTVSRDEACRLIATASTPAGFRRVALPGARLLRFEQPGMPTWLPKIVPSSKLVADDVRGLAAHCAEMTCSDTRPYCAWSGSTDAQHVWFGMREGDLAISGAADYDGE